MKTCKTENWIEMDKKGFEMWNNMSNEVSPLPYVYFLKPNLFIIIFLSLQKRHPYICQARKINSAYQEALTKEANDMIKVNNMSILKFLPFKFFRA